MAKKKNDQNFISELLGKLKASYADSQEQNEHAAQKDTSDAEFQKQLQTMLNKSTPEKSAAKKEAKKNSEWYKLDKLQKAYAVSGALKSDLFKSQILAQLLLNFPTQMPYEKQKEILDKISQSTIRDNTPEEIEKVSKGEAYYDFYNV